MEKLTPVEQANLKQELDKRYKERKRRQELHDEVAKDCEARFKKAISCKVINTLKRKKLKIMGLNR